MNDWLGWSEYGGLLSLIWACQMNAEDCDQLLASESVSYHPFKPGTPVSLYELCHRKPCLKIFFVIVILPPANPSFGMTLTLKLYSAAFTDYILQLVPYPKKDWLGPSLKARFPMTQLMSSVPCHLWYPSLPGSPNCICPSVVISFCISVLTYPLPMLAHCRGESSKYCTQTAVLQIRSCGFDYASFGCMGVHSPLHLEKNTTGTPMAPRLK